MFESQVRFVTECRNAFRDLVSRFGFSEPETEVKGRECFMKYQKGHRTISISWTDADRGTLRPCGTGRRCHAPGRTR